MLDLSCLRLLEGIGVATVSADSSDYSSNPITMITTNWGLRQQQRMRYDNKEQFWLLRRLEQSVETLFATTNSRTFFCAHISKD